ncbi:hypothetical protein F183_A31990 [Bryobacterales bacterium F-183]|nr:hypothetical protein F183_A31990 [Bryobacterales bacterium F-183]
METDKIDARSPGSGKIPGKNRVRSGSGEFGSNGFASKKFGLAPMPLEWMDDSSWRLPSGKALAEFALQAGFLAPLMLRMPRLMGAAGQQKPTAGKKGR